MPFQKAPVQFGVFDWIEWDELPVSEIYEQRLKMLEYADEAGFFCYHLAEHHVTPHSLAPSPGLFSGGPTDPEDTKGWVLIRSSRWVAFGLPFTPG